jgi:hypothetical protein
MAGTQGLLNRYIALSWSMMWLVGALLIFVFLSSVLSSLVPLSNVLIVPLLLMMAIWWLWALVVVSAKTAWMGIWDASLAILVSVWLCSLLAIPMWRYGGDYVHLALVYPAYSARIAAQHGAAISFYWGNRQGFFGWYSADYYLVYDPSSEGAAQSGSQAVDGYRIETDARHMIGNFYLLARSRYKEPAP